MAMAHVFVCYARSDEAVAAELESALVAAGFSTFLDVHPSSGIAAGTDWLDELHRELSRAGCLLYLSSAASAASPWCQAELLNAYWSGKLVIPVQLDDTDPPLMQRIQALKMTEPPGAGTAQVLGLLSRWFPYSASARPVSRTTNPYPGLRSFGESEAELFFGRWDLADGIVRRLTAPRASPEEFMLAISGPSGCGKSSLVRAAVLPLLRARHDGIVCVGPLEPGTMSCEAIRALARSSSPRDLRSESETRAGAGSAPQLIVVLDQAERLFTEIGGEDPAALVAEFEHLAGQDPWFRSLVVFRSDVMASPALDETFGRYLVRPVRVPVMRRNEMRQAILAPATVAGIRFDEGLVDRILDDTGGGQALPLLAYNLWNLAEMAAGDRRISRQLYEQSGGVRATLREQADGVLKHLAQAGIARDQVLGALLRLASVAPGHLPSARHASSAALSEVAREVLDAFVARKLVIKDLVSGDILYQAAHEELLRWPTLADYIEQHQSDLITLDGLERKAELWAGGKRELLDGADLAHARYFDRRGLSSHNLKVLAEASRVNDRPPFLTRVTRPVALFGTFTLLFLLYEILLPPLVLTPFGTTDHRTGQTTTGALGTTLAFLLLCAGPLIYVGVVRKRLRISRFGYLRLDGRPCGARRYATRWLLAPIGIVLTPLSRCFSEDRLTWVDQRTGTELVRINRDGSRRNDARAP
jgi:TIR domain